MSDFTIRVRIVTDNKKPKDVPYQKMVVVGFAPDNSELKFRGRVILRDDEQQLYNIRELDVHPDDVRPLYDWYYNQPRVSFDGNHINLHISFSHGAGKHRPEIKRIISSYIMSQLETMHNFIANMLNDELGQAGRWHVQTSYTLFRDITDKVTSDQVRDRKFELGGYGTLDGRHTETYSAELDMDKVKEYAVAVMGDENSNHIWIDLIAPESLAQRETRSELEEAFSYGDNVIVT